MLGNFKGAAWLAKLHEHGRQLAEELIAEDIASAEEVEREIEQQEEREQEAEVDTVAPVVWACAEKDWACPKTAVQLTSAHSFAHSQGVQVIYSEPCMQIIIPFRRSCISNHCACSAMVPLHRSWRRNGE